MTEATTDTLLSFVTTPEGMDDAEFNTWLETVHFRELVDNVDGIVSVRRFKLMASIPRGAEEKIQPYIAVYTLNKPAPEVAAAMGEVVKSGKLTELDWKGRGPQVYFGTYVSTIS